MSYFPKKYFNNTLIIVVLGNTYFEIKITKIN